MAYPFVPARWSTPGAMTEARGILWHMAEGYGTVGYFTRVDQGVSSHYVIERTGRIVQMVRHRDASWSAHWRYDADSSDADDCGGLYGPDVARAVLGDGYRDLNRYVVAIEVEGYRRDGPNTAQRASIIELAYALRRELPTIRGNLGHRDVQDYKSCPGCRFPWDTIGGHGLFAEDDMAPIYAPTVGTRSAIWPKGSRMYSGPTGTDGPGMTPETRRYLVVAQDAPTDPARYLVDGGPGKGGRMAWLAAAGATSWRSESFDAGASAASLAAEGVVRGDW